MLYKEIVCILPSSHLSIHPHISWVVTSNDAWLVINVFINACSQVQTKNHMWGNLKLPFVVNTLDCLWHNRRLHQLHPDNHNDFSIITVDMCNFETHSSGHQEKFPHISGSWYIADEVGSKISQKAARMWKHTVMSVYGYTHNPLIPSL